MHDCIVVGAGPAGLTAALYMGRYRRDVLVVHDNTARAARIPLTHNAPGFPDGISGADLLERMTRHAKNYGVAFEESTVKRLAVNGGAFQLSTGDGNTLESRTVILATGLLLNQVDLPHDVHEQAIEDDVLRYCAVCDAFEHIDRKIAVVGYEQSGASQALFLSRYSDQVTLIPEDIDGLTEDEVAQLADNGVAVTAKPMEKVAPGNDSMAIWLEGESRPEEYEVLYPCFGTRARTDLAAQLGLEVDESGCLDSSSHFKTTVPGFYAAGDVVQGLDQISVAMGHGAIAATKAHTWLREADGEA